MTSINEWALSHEDLVKILFYNTETGVFTWQIDRGPRAQAGNRAGYETSKGYRHIEIGDFAYKEHRLAIFYVNKVWPVAEVDHVNGNKADNRWENLREATSQQNRRNTGKRSNNTTGFRGVVFHKGSGKFKAQIGLSPNTKTHLGTFNTAEEASAAYEEAAKKHFERFYPDKREIN